MLSWTLLVTVIAAVLVGWFWLDSLKQRERANAAAQEACERANLQFLDGTVAFARMKLYRARSGRLALRRTYVFDYTARSIERQQGFVVLAGDRIETVGFAHGTEESPPATPVAAARPGLLPPGSPSERSQEASNVLDLEQWRRQRPPRTSSDEPRRSDSGDGRG